MSKVSKLFLSVFFLLTFYFPLTAFSVAAAEFSNPIVKTADAGCAAENLRAERFSAEISQDERVRLCAAVEKITNKLNATNWSPELSAELKNIWQVFSTETVILRPMPNGTSSRVAAMAEPFPAGSTDGKFDACVYVRPEKSQTDAFFQLLLHELRHVLDFHDTWKNRTAINSLEVERRAYLLMSKLTEETPEKENFSGVPKFWKESWRKRSAAEISLKRERTIQKFLRKSKFYQTFAQDQSKQTLDFSYLNNTASSNNSAESKSQQFASTYRKKDDIRLPDRPLLPSTAAVISQNIQESNFNLEKPQNPRDAQEILRVALSNEKKLYYGMNNFVYDQKLAFQCWRKGKISASFSETNTVARTERGQALLKPVSLQTATPSKPCALDDRSLSTDFTETFWASPALEKMPIKFVGFYEIEGKTLARYTVFQPDAQLFAALEQQYPLIKPFRVFVGTIFVSPEDGQIVRFWGTSFPEETVTGKNSQKVWGSYSVTALRQKLNIDTGLWVTVHISTVAVANVRGNFQPFSYTVKMENYRQTTSDVIILDDDDVADNSSSSQSAK